MYYWGVADGTLCICAFGLVEDDLVPTVGALARRQLVGPDVDDIATGTLNLFLCKEARLRFGILAAHRARNRKLRHVNVLPLFILDFHVIQGKFQ